MRKVTRRSLSVLLFAFSSSAAVHAPLSAQGRKFTVADSIEMQHFTDPYPDTSRTVSSFSPDRRYFAVVTTRGLLRQNRLESSVWLFDVNAELAFLEGGRVRPEPELLVSRAGINDSEQQELQASIILPRWSQDGKSLLFLGRDDSAAWHLYRIGIKARKLERLSSAKQNVVQYQEANGLIAYAVSIPWPVTNSPQMLVGTGERLGNLLFPDKHPTYPNQNELWIYSNGNIHPVRSNVTHEVIRLNTHYGDTLFAVDPKGQYAVVASAVQSIPESWTEYVPGIPTQGIKPWPPERLKEAFGVDIPERLLFVDLRTGKNYVIFDAPLGRDVGWIWATKILWSSDGRELLLCNTFLPLEGSSGEERKEREQHPEILSFAIADRSWSRVTTYRESDATESNRWHIKDVEWGGSSDEVAVTYTELGPAAEVFQRSNAGWTGITGKRVDGSSTSASGLPIRAEIKEDLKTPPALYALASGSSEATLIWNPNPQLAQFDLGSSQIYNWKDNYGRDVKGVLIRPPHYDPAQRYPLVIESRDYYQDRFVVDGTYPTAVAARAMAADGLMVLQAGEPAVPRAELFRKETPAALAGYEALIAKMDAERLIDPKRVGIIGFSRTCDNVMYSVTQDPHLFAAATIANGFTYGLLGYLEIVDESVNNIAMKQWALHFDGSPLGQGETAFLKESPIFNLQRVATPIRVETRGPANMLTDWETYAGLRSLDKPVDLIVLPHATHVVSMPADLMVSQQGDVDWFRFWLQGYEDPDPTKASQYRRWEGLRQLGVTEVQSITGH